MSWQPAEEPDCVDGPGDVELLIRPHGKDLGGFQVRRVLPSADRRNVGPYVFFDHMGPVTFPAGKGIDVRPHPHIGLATVTYLFEGEILHRDSLGSVQPIRPGAVNLMTAGRGIVHSERTPMEQRATGAAVHGIQLWLALPVALEETDPTFAHFPADSIPAVETGEARITVIIGEAYGVSSPVATPSPTLYVEVMFVKGGKVPLPGAYEERAVYVVEGRVAIGAADVTAGDMAVVRPSAEPVLRGDGGARIMVIGGEPFPEPRTVWWNFVSSDKARIEQAKQDWRAERFDAVPGETEFIPLPGQSTVRSA